MKPVPQAVPRLLCDVPIRDHTRHALRTAAAARPYQAGVQCTQHRCCQSAALAEQAPLLLLLLLLWQGCLHACSMCPACAKTAAA